MNFIQWAVICVVATIVVSRLNDAVLLLRDIRDTLYRQEKP